MGKLNAFGINFNVNRQVFYPGEQLTGYVVVDLKSPMETRGLRIEFEGKGYCHWTEQHGSGDNRRTVHYTGKEQIFSFVSALFGSLPNSGGSRINLPAGQSIYQFTFTIPQNIPSSFEGGIGYIRYELKAQIDKPWKFDHKVKRPIVINDIIDPNNPNYQYSPGGTEHKEVGCLCCAAGPLDVSANINRACYCPGESILITANAQNNTTRDMTAMKAKLVCTTSFHSSNKTKRREKVVARIDGAAIPRGQFAKWDNEVLPIPAVPPSIQNSSVISVVYEVRVEIDVPWGMDPTVKMPVMIGTIPFRATYMQAVANAPPPNPQFQNMSALPPPGIFQDMPPPSYAAAVGEQPVNIAGDDDHYTQGNLSYLPVYTFAQPYQGPPAQQAPPQNPPLMTGQQPYPTMPPVQQPYPTIPPVQQPYPTAPPVQQPYPTAPPVQQQPITQQPGYAPVDTKSGPPP